MEGLYDRRVEKVIPGFEFVAIMDDRTTEICAERNGVVFTREQLDTGFDIIPPLHYNCRSTLVGVFDDEYAGPSEKELKAPVMEGFGGWESNLKEK
jgi:uncharacterized protein with gpF-like domain